MNDLSINKGVELIMEMIDRLSVMNILDSSKNNGNYLALSHIIKIDNMSKAAERVNKWLTQYNSPVQTLSSKTAKQFLRFINTLHPDQTHKVELMPNVSENILLRISKNLILHCEYFSGEQNNSLNIWLEGIVINENTAKDEIVLLFNWIADIVKKSKSAALLSRY